ncbi:cell division protein FtsW [Candidatus Gracilibacteria bacterium]|jgi:cell division protein FtsW|nr:cell division protein FtsW [Candidatus Gracilibacteria bacterium]
MKQSFKFDTILALTVLFLLIFGLIMITSIGVPKSIELSAPGVQYPNCSDANVDCYLLFKKHLVRLGIGIVMFFLAWKIPMKFWKKIAPAFFVLIVIMLIMVITLGKSFGTIATNWLLIFNTSFQPSEFARLALILYLSYWFTKRRDSVESFHDGFLPFCFICGMILLPVVLGNDYGSIAVMSLIAVSIYFIAGAKLKHLGLGFLGALIAAIVVVSFVPHVRERFQGFMSVDKDCIEDYCWQSQQANIAVGSGGLLGKGLTQGVQKSYWLPQASDDFIFAASSEELGFIRIIFVVLAYLVIALRGYQIANKANGSFEMFVAVGITTWITVQAFVNIAVNTALFPVTGITLPFVSYGGSSLIADLVAIAILLNISENTTYYASSPNRWGDRRSRHPELRRYRRA